MMKRRGFLLAAGTAALAGAAPGMAWAQQKPLRLVVPFPAGGATDIVARLLSAPLSQALGRTVIVDNKAGAGGSLGMADVARSEPDGLTLGVATTSTHGVNPAVYKHLPYDAAKDFAAVAELVKAPGVLVVPPSLGVRDMASFLKLLRSKPNQLFFASAGVGTISHMWGELFKSTTGTSMVHVPFRGAAPAMNDLLGGRVHAYFDQVASSLPHIRAGKLVALAVSWASRLQVLPDVPTFGELSMFSNNVPSWFGLVAPAKTPPAMLQKLADAVARCLAQPEVVEHLAAQGLYPSDLHPRDFAVQIRKEIDRMSRVAKYARISLD